MNFSIRADLPQHLVVFGSLRRSTCTMASAWDAPDPADLFPGARALSSFLCDAAPLGAAEIDWIARSFVEHRCCSFIIQLSCRSAQFEIRVAFAESTPHFQQ
jgi:hypothetical protein